MKPNLVTVGAVFPNNRRLRLKRLLSRSVPILAAAASLILYTKIAYADPIWIPGNEQAYADIEIVRPVFEDNLLSEPSAAAVFVTFRTLSKARAALVLEIPYTRTTYNYYYGGEYFVKKTESSQGNMYLGMQDRISRNLLVEFGIRLPTASDVDIFANATGILSDYDRLDAFVPDWYSVRGIINILLGRLGLSARIRLGLSHFFKIRSKVPSGKRKSNFLYSAHLWYETGNVSFGGGFSGVRDNEESDTEGQIGLTAAYRFGFVKPGVQVRFPLTKGIDQSVNYIYGFFIQILPD